MCLGFGAIADCADAWENSAGWKPCEGTVLRVRLGLTEGARAEDAEAALHDCPTNTRVWRQPVDALIFQPSQDVGCGTVGMGASLCGVAFAGCAVIANCPVMAINALCRRHLAPPTNPVTGGTFPLVYLSRLTPLVRTFYQEKCALLPDKWKEGRGVVKLAQIEESITYDQLDYGRVNMMLKKEVNFLNFGDMQLPSKARGIQFCTNLRTAYQLGCEQTSFCHALAAATAEPVSIDGVDVLLRYTAEMSPAELGAFATACEQKRAAHVMSFIDERDGKNWDANVQLEHREALAEWYREFSPALSAQAKAQITVKGNARVGVKITYDVSGTVKSGHWDTSSGNGALNLEVTIQAILGMPPELKPAAVWGMVLGDDLLLWLYFDRLVEPAQYVAAINKAEATLGIHPVRGLFHDVLNVSFCSMGFYWTNRGQLVAVPKIGRCFGKLFWTVTPLAGRDPQRLASTIAHAFYPTYSGYRPMRQFLKHHMKVAPIETNIDGSLPYVCREFEMPALAGVNWIEGNIVKYGIPPDALADMDQILEECPVGVVDHPVVNQLITQDLSDPPQRRGVLA